MTHRIKTLALVVIAALPGCTSCDTPPENALLNCQASVVVPAAVKTDILFVVDDSGSMSEEQQNLANNLDAFIDALIASPVQDDFRIGVTNTSVEEFPNSSGVVRTTYAVGPAKNVPFPAGALVAVQTDLGGNVIPGAFVYDAGKYAATGGWGGTRILDKGSPTLAADFKANVRVGLDGSGKEQPFRAARLALSDRLADTNQGFLRDGARLAVIFLSDEDDCSDTASPFATDNNTCHLQATKTASPPILDTIDDFKAFLLGPVGGEIRDVSVGAIAGLDPASLAPSCGDPQCADKACSTAFDQGDRFKALADSFGSLKAQLGSICDTSFRNSLVKFAESLAPNAVPLAQVPADYRMLAISVTKTNGTNIPCKVAKEGDTGQAGADAVYSDATMTRQAQITFQNACKLDLGDKIDVRVVCVN